MSGSWAKYESPNSMRNLNYLIVLVSMSIGIQHALAQPPANSQQRQQRFRQLLQRFDENGNGQLDPSERLAVQKFIQQRNSKNPMQRPQMQRPQNTNPRPQGQRPQTRPGQPTQPSQPEQVRPNTGRRPGNGQRREGFSILPRQREHKLDKSRLLNRFDINRDGQLSASERAAAIEAMGK